jgi:hypothetical protein
MAREAFRRRCAGWLHVEDATCAVGVEDGTVVAGRNVVRREVPALDETEGVVWRWICVDAEAGGTADVG